MHSVMNIVGPLILPMAFIGLYLSQRKKTKFPACGSCGYNLTGKADVSSACPECGGNLLAVGIVAPGTRQKNKLAYGLSMTVIYLVLVIPVLGLIALGLLLSFVK